MSVKNRKPVVQTQDRTVYYQNEKGGKVYSLIITLAFDTVMEFEAINDTLHKIIPNAKRAWWS